MNSATAGRHSTFPAVLIAIYAITVAIHVYLLAGVAQFPHVASDEVQYLITAENIHWGNGFIIRGGFNDSLPPLYPCVLAVSHMIMGESRTATLLVCCLLMCAGVFPAYWLGRYIGIDIPSARLLAAATGMLPHTFYAGTYMAESLQFPLFLFAFYQAVKWLDGQDRRSDVLLGAVLGALLLVKVQSLQLISAFLLAVAIQVCRIWRVERAKAYRIAGHALTVLAVTAAMEMAWIGFKHFNHASAVGMYGTVVQDQGLPHLSARLCLAYFADFLLAPGLITMVPLFYWFRRNRGSIRAIFVASTLAVQLGATSILDGGLTGWLRERLFIYSFPIIMVFAALGLDEIKTERARYGRILMVSVPLLLILLLMVYPFHVSSIIEVPWANAVGAFNGANFNVFSKVRLGVMAACLASAVSLLVLRTKWRTPIVFSVFVLLFHSFSLLASSVGLTQWAAVGERDTDPIMRWLSEQGLRPGNRVLISGRQGYFESRRDWSKNDSAFLGWTWQLGLSEALEWRIEALGRYDVRMIPSPASLTTVGREDDWLLSTAAFDKFHLVSFHFPLYLYRVRNSGLTNGPVPRYATYVSAEKFYTQVGRKTGRGVITGTGTGREGYLVYGPYLPLPGGSYRVSFEVIGDPSATLSLDVLAGLNNVLARQSTTLPEVRPMEFLNVDSSLLQYRIIGRSSSAFEFRGTRIEQLNHPPGAPPVPVVSSQRVPKSRLPAEIAGKEWTTWGSCYIDSINERPPALATTLLQRDGLRVVGWAADTKAGLVPDTVYLEFLSENDKRTFFLKAGRNRRPDVASAFAKPALSNAGVILSTTGGAQIPTGKYQIKVLQVDRSVAECDAKRYVEIR